jgi:hypothetical protein
MLACSVFGHRFRFSSAGRVMTWTCARGCGAGGQKVYDTAAEATRYAKAFDKEDRKAIGEHPTLTMLPLALARKVTGRRRAADEG